jgi:hypothetical protein
MGKFFVAGLFLGAAVTGSAMHFLVAKGLKGAKLDEKLADYRDIGFKEGKAEEEKVREKLLAEKATEIAQQFRSDIEDRDKKAKELQRQVEKFEADLQETKNKLAITEGERDEMKKRINSLQTQMGLMNPTPKDLLVRATRLRPVQVELWRTFGEAVSVMSQALVGWPDVGRARRAAAEIGKLAERHTRLARDVRIYVENNSKRLADELEDLGPYRADVQESDLKMIDELARRMKLAAEKMRTDSVKVSAKDALWTDTQVFVERGDIVHVRAEGRWHMSTSMGPAGPEGWDSASQYKLDKDCRAGALILRVGVGEDYHPAYLGKPVEAGSAGRISFRINDEDVSDNGGHVTAEVAACSPKALRQVVGLWAEKVAKKD